MQQTLAAQAGPAARLAKQLKAAEILERLEPKYPNHPGIPHYIIHLNAYASQPRISPLNASVSAMLQFAILAATMWGTATGALTLFLVVR